MWGSYPAVSPHVVVTGIKEAFSPTRSLKCHARQELSQIELLTVQKQVHCFLNVAIAFVSKQLSSWRVSLTERPCINKTVCSVFALNLTPTSSYIVHNVMFATFTAKSIATAACLVLHIHGYA